MGDNIKNEPTWIGVEIKGSNTNVKVCIGINQDGGHEVSYKMEDDKEWHLDNCEVSVKQGVNARVFDNENKLI